MKNNNQPIAQNANKSAMTEPSLDAQVDGLRRLARSLRRAPGAKQTVQNFPVSAVAQLRNSGRAMLLADIMALALSFMIGGVAAWAINVFMLDDGFQQLLTETSFKQFMLFMTLGGTAILWLDQQGHYRERLPFWETVGHVITVTMVGMLIGGFI